MNGFSDRYSTYIIAYCVDTNSFFVTNQRCFFYEYDKEFKTEEEGILYFKHHIKDFVNIRNNILKSTGGWSESDFIYLENTSVSYNKQGENNNDLYNG